MRMKFIGVAILALAVAACTANAPPAATTPVAATTTPAPTTSASTQDTSSTASAAPTPEDTAAFTADWDGRSNSAGWTAVVHQALIGPGAPLLALTPSDAATFCPNFASLNPHDREQFWITFISAMAWPESRFRPTTRYDEPGLAEDSIGLMQLSLSDGRIYGCSFTIEADIEDPAKNLECAVRILARNVPRDSQIGGDGNHLGAARYFGTLRTDDVPGHREARAHIISKTGVAPGCAA
jgi:hypothetical protein